MALTKKQVEEYRKKLDDSEYMEKAINGIAGNIFGSKHVKKNVILNMNSTEEKKMAKLILNDHLFETLENLTDKSIKGDDLKEQIQRAEAVAKIAQKIIDSQNFMLKATLAAMENGIEVKEAKTKLKQLTE
jgi:hypothetical protein